MLGFLGRINVGKLFQARIKSRSERREDATSVTSVEIQVKHSSQHLLIPLQLILQEWSGPKDENIYESAR